MKKIWFTIYKYNHGCCGVPYKSKLEAIKDDRWGMWTDERVRKQFNLGQGTMKDFERYCRNNNFIPVTEEEFWKIAAPLGEEWMHSAEKFINETIERCGW